MFPWHAPSSSSPFLPPPPPPPCSPLLCLRQGAWRKHQTLSEHTVIVVIVPDTEADWWYLDLSLLSSSSGYVYGPPWLPSPGKGTSRSHSSDNDLEVWRNPLGLFSKAEQPSHTFCNHMQCPRSCSAIPISAHSVLHQSRPLNHGSLVKS